MGEIEHVGGISRQFLFYTYFSIVYLLIIYYIYIQRFKNRGFNIYIYTQVNTIIWNIIYARICVVELNIVLHMYLLIYMHIHIYIYMQIIHNTIYVFQSQNIDIVTGICANCDITRLHWCCSGINVTQLEWLYI